MPNRRRRKLSTAISAVAAVAVASPCAYFLVYESTTGSKPPVQHEFKRAALATDLPGEVMNALSQGLSQFGINLPPIPGLTGGAGASALGSPGLGTSLGSPGLGSPGLGTPGLTTPGLSTPGLGTPGLTSPTMTPGALPTTPDAGLSPGLGNPGLTSPAGLTPGLANPGFGPGQPPVVGAGLDPGADGTYPIIGDPSTLGGGAPIGGGGGGVGGGGGGLVNDVIQAANQLGAQQAIDLIKGVLMPAIMQGIQHGAPGAPGALPGAVGAPGALPAVGAPGALPAAAGALPGPVAAPLPATSALTHAPGAVPHAPGARPHAAAPKLPPV